MMATLSSFSEDGATYYELFITCPVCLKYGDIQPNTYWKHGANTCNTGRIYVGDNAHYYCYHCKKHSHVSYWRYRCPGKSHSIRTDDACVVISSEMAPIIGLAAQCVGIAGIAWLKRFLDNLED